MPTVTILWRCHPSGSECHIKARRERGRNYVWRSSSARQTPPQFLGSSRTNLIQRGDHRSTSSLQCPFKSHCLFSMLFSRNGEEKRCTIITKLRNFAVRSDELLLVNKLRVLLFGANYKYSQYLTPRNQDTTPTFQRIVIPLVRLKRIEKHATFLLY